MDKKNWIRLAAFGGGALVFFFAVPPILGLLSGEAQVIATLLFFAVINQIFIGIVGWQSYYLPKWGIWIPLAVIVIYAGSELVFYHAVSGSMEFNYLQTGYIAYFLKKLLVRRKQIAENRQNKPFPKGVSRK